MDVYYVDFGFLCNFSCVLFYNVWDRCWVNKSPFCLNLDPVLLFVYLSVVLLIFLLEGTLFSFLLVIEFCCCVYHFMLITFAPPFVVSFVFKPSLGRELEGILFQFLWLILCLFL